MESNTNDNRLEELVKDIYEYLDLRVASAKLSATQHLSILFSSIFGVLIVIILSGVALLFGAVALTWALATYIGLGYAALAISIVFLTCAILVYKLRNKIIADSMVRMFAKMFFDQNKL